MHKPNCSSLTSQIFKANEVSEKFDAASDILNLDKMRIFKSELLASLEKDPDYVRYREIEARMGEAFFGVEKIKEAFGIPVDFESVPPIPFTDAEINFALANDLQLVYRISHDERNLRLSILDMQAIELEVPRKGYGIIPSFDYRDSRLSSKQLRHDTPRPSWAMTGVLNRDMAYNYLEQMNYLTSFVQTVKNDARDTMLFSADPEIELEKMGKLMKWLPLTKAQSDEDKREVATILASLEINKKLRPTLVESVYDHILTAETKYSRMNQGVYFTGELDKDGAILCLDWDRYRRKCIDLARRTADEKGYLTLNWTK
jgi:hypothetical protein